MDTLHLNDQLQIEKMGISIEKIENQLNHFKNGFLSIDIVKPATIDDGIIHLTTKQKELYINTYHTAILAGINISRFVPASGAATRMFKNYFDYLNTHNKLGKVSQPSSDITEFAKEISKLPFYNELFEKLNITPQSLIDNDALLPKIIDCLLDTKGINYGQLPKGVLKFHANSHPIEITTPIHEHMIEAAIYGKDFNDRVQIHFTVSPDHEKLFKHIIEIAKPIYEAHYNVHYHISFSHQKLTTDTIAVTSSNEPFRDEKGSLVFRPGGHGALIENLNDIKSDIVFIKNIDNVVPHRKMHDTIEYKKILAGLLISIQTKIFSTLAKLNHASSDEIQNEIIPFIKKDIGISLPEKVELLDGDLLKQFLNGILNRPIRVCGMVKNEGEPGGGPFWVRDSEGNLSMQIVESSQIDLTDPAKVEIIKKSTHFNPVDIVCSLKNYQNKKINLTLYVDPDTGFISKKSMNGKPLKALELPGLWNGAMAHWLTFFVEVPLTTFNPVKTLNDLFRDNHQ